MGDDHAHDISKHVRIYMYVFAALTVLTIITVAVSRFHIGDPETDTWNIVLGLLIATGKAALVALFFMHLSAEKHHVYRILALAGIFVLGLFFLTWLAYADYIRIH